MSALTDADRLQRCLAQAFVIVAMGAWLILAAHYLAGVVA